MTAKPFIEAAERFRARSQYEEAAAHYLMAALYAKDEEARAEFREHAKDMLIAALEVRLTRQVEIAQLEQMYA